MPASWTPSVSTNNFLQDGNVVLRGSIHVKKEGAFHRHSLKFRHEEEGVHERGSMSRSLMNAALHKSVVAQNRIFLCDVLRLTQVIVAMSFNAPIKAQHRVFVGIRRVCLSDTA